METGAGAGIHGERPRASISLSLGQHPTVFQTEILAILECVRENVNRRYVNQQISIATDSQAALKALASNRVSSRLVWNCHKELETLGERNRVNLLWVPGHTRVDGNEKADELARQGAATTFCGPEPVLGITKSSARGVITDWVKNKHKQHWRDIPGNRHGKIFIKGPCPKRTEELLRKNRSQLRIITGLLTGHFPVKKHLHTIGKFNGDLNCRLCGKGPETVEHIILECEALARRRYQIYGQTQTDPESISTRPFVNLCYLIRGTGVLNWVE